MASLHDSMDDHAGMDRDLLLGINQSIQTFSNLNYEENETTPTDLDLASSPPLTSAGYGGDGILFWISFKSWFECDAIISVTGFLYLGRSSFDFCFKRGADNLQLVLLLRRLLRRIRRAYCFPFGKDLVRSEGGMVSVRHMQSMSANYIQSLAANPVLFIQSDPMNQLSSHTLVFVFVALDLTIFILVFVFVVLDLTILDLVMKVKIAVIPSASVSSSVAIVTASSMPSQPDSFHHRHVKTDSDYHGYLRHFGYILATVTISWVTVTLIALGNTGFVFKISLARNVSSSPLRERRFSETVFSSERIELIGKNWWGYCNLYEHYLILKNICKVPDFLNRLSM